MNGQIDYASDDTAPFDVGTMATYSCDAGFELQGGDTVRTCMGDGSTRFGIWSGLTPTCVGGLIMAEWLHTSEGA